MKYDGTRAETRFCLSAKRTSPFNRKWRQFCRLLAAEVCASAVVMLDTPSSEVVKGPGYPLHSPLSPSLPLPCVAVCHHVSPTTQFGHQPLPSKNTRSIISEMGNIVQTAVLLFHAYILYLHSTCRPQGSRRSAVARRRVLSEKT